MKKLAVDVSGDYLTCLVFRVDKDSVFVLSETSIERDEDVPWFTRTDARRVRERHPDVSEENWLL